MDSTLETFVGREYEAEPVTLERWQAFLWAEATRNPAERFRHAVAGRQVAPPTFGQVVAREAAGTDGLEAELRNGDSSARSVFLGGQRFDFERPLRVGSTYRASAEITDLARKSGSTGDFRVLTISYDVRDDEGHAFAMETDFVVRASGDAFGRSGPTDGRGDTSDEGTGRDEDEIVGHRRIDRVASEDMQLVTALVGDPNPLHFDPEYVADIGLPGRVNQGPVNTAYAVQAARDGFPPTAVISTLSVQFEGFVTEGQTVDAFATTASGGSRDGERLALELATDDGRTVLTGTASVGTD